MSREINEDFSSLIKFLKEYNLQNQALNEDFIKVLSQQHKKFYSYLTCIAELVHLSKDKTTKPELSEMQLSFLIESCSDIGSALFVMTHGAYKASKMMLRSSIETFNKGFNLDEIPDIDKEKSVFNIFDKIGVIDFFLKSPNDLIFGNVHQNYKLLCQDTHTATKINMEQITALSYFPTFNLDDALKVSQILSRLVQSYNTLICIKYNAQFQRMHHRNRETIMENIPKEYRPMIQGIS